MSTVPAQAAKRPAAISLKPDRLDQALAAASVALLAAVLVALWKGQAEWSRVPAVVWVHMATILVALVLTPIMLLRRRGDQPHRVLGWVWAVSLFGTAFVSLFVHVINPRGFSPIHLLSIWTLIQVPLIVIAARKHDLPRHRRAVRGMVIGALLIAGFFTFPFGRLLGRWLFG